MSTRNSWLIQLSKESPYSLADLTAYARTIRDDVMRDEFGYEDEGLLESFVRVGARNAAAENTALGNLDAVRIFLKPDDPVATQEAPAATPRPQTWMYRVVRGGITAVVYGTPSPRDTIVGEPIPLYTEPPSSEASGTFDCVGIKESFWEILTPNNLEEACEFLGKARAEIRALREALNEEYAEEVKARDVSGHHNKARHAYAARVLSTIIDRFGLAKGD